MTTMTTDATIMHVPNEWAEELAAFLLAKTRESVPHEARG